MTVLLITLLVGFGLLTLFAVIDRARIGELEEVEVEILLPVDEEEWRFLIQDPPADGQGGEP